MGSEMCIRDSLRCPRTGLMVRHRSRRRLPALLRAIILFKLEQLSILTVCFSGTTALVSFGQEKWQITSRCRSGPLPSLRPRGGEPRGSLFLRQRSIPARPNF